MTTTDKILSQKPAQHDFVVRCAVPDDVSAIATLDRELWNTWANPSTLYRQLIDLYPETVLVAHSQDGQYAGCAVGLVRANPLKGWVLSIDIAEQFRSRGLGKEFLTKLIAAFHRVHAEEVFAIIDPNNSASQRLFGSLGFSQIGIEKNYFGLGRDQEKWRLNLDVAARVE